MRWRHLGAALRCHFTALCALGMGLFVSGDLVRAEEARRLYGTALIGGEALTETTVLTAEQWSDLDRAVDRGLGFLSRQQREDGSFESLDYAQPAVTSFCVMAFLSRGHVPGEGPYGEQIRRAIDFVLSTQQPSGLMCALPPGTKDWSTKGTYNHAISGVMLGEVYGMAQPAQHEHIRTAIESALAFTRRLQQLPKPTPVDRGGWRYLKREPRIDSDLSCTAWHLMFYRSARNAGFDVPESDIEPAVDFVKRCFDSNVGSFSYGARTQGRGPGKFTRAMAGAGILSLSLAGQHQSEMARQAARYVLDRPFDDFNGEMSGRRGRYFYAAYHCSQGMFQRGGEHWAEFYPVLLKAFVENQLANGSWEREAHRDAALGLTYSTSLAVLALTPPYQLLPIYQR